MDRFVLKVGKKGVVILPKRLRAEAGIEEESLILAEVRNNNIILRPLKPVTTGQASSFRAGYVCVFKLSR
jgi:AbrB family looped-hinge helix DNA binding protein